MSMNESSEMQCESSIDLSGMAALSLSALDESKSLMLEAHTLLSLSESQELNNDDEDSSDSEDDEYNSMQPVFNSDGTIPLQTLKLKPGKAKWTPEEVNI